MRKVSSLLAIALLAGCGGGGGGTAPAQPVPISTNAATKSGLVTPQFTFFIPASKSTNQHGRKPNFVSAASQSVTIVLTSVGGAAPNVTPTSVTSTLTPPCTAGCTVSGPPSPPGQADSYTITTYDGAAGAGARLDVGSVTFTPTAGTSTSTPVTLAGIPFTIAIASLPTTFAANTTNQTANLTVTVKDHAGQTITGTYATPVRITDPDSETTNGTHLTGTNVGVGCTNSCVDLKNDTDTATLAYNGLAENPVTLASSNGDVFVASGTAGTATFTPVLNAIVKDNGPTTSLGGDGIDLFTTDNTSPTGYSGTIQYREAGFTNSPYSKSLAITSGSANACTAFATVAAGTTDATKGTPFTATAKSTPTAGVCTIVITDNLTDQPNALPTFRVTYTTSNLTANAIRRHR